VARQTGGLIEIKSFTSALQLKEARKQAADYFHKCGLEYVQSYEPIIKKI